MGKPVRDEVSCPGCGTVLDVTGIAPGSWLGCAKCSQPVEVPNQAFRVLRGASRPGSGSRAEVMGGTMEDDGSDASAGSVVVKGEPVDDTIVGFARTVRERAGTDRAGHGGGGIGPVRKVELDPRDLARIKPWRRSGRSRVVLLNLILLAMIGGFAQMFFVAMFLNLRNPGELQGSWFFGFLLTGATAWVVWLATRPRRAREPHELN